MKFINTILFFLLFINTPYAQKPSKLDSLKNVLAHLPAEGKSFAGDTLRVRVLCEIGEKETNPKKSSEYLNAAKLIAEKQNDKKGLLLILDKFSQLYQYQPIRAIEYYIKGLALAEDMHEYEKLIRYTERIRNSYLNLGDNENAMKFAKYNLSLNQKHNNLEAQLLSLNNVGIVYFQMRQYDIALRYFLNIHQLNTTLKSKKIENAYLINSAKVYINKKQNQKALTNLQQALKIKDGYKDKVSFVANEIALIYLSENKLNQALKYAKIAENAVKGLSDDHQISVCKTFAKIYKRKNNTQEYAKYLSKFTNISLKEDSVKNAKLTEFINLDYVSEKQLLEINDLNINIKEQEYKNKLLIGGIVTSIFIIIVIIFFYRTIQKKSHQINLQNQRIEELNKSLESKVIERTSELSEANKELIKKNFEISEALFKGQTIERKRVAAELHDNLGSTLSALKWRLEALDSESLNKRERAIYESIKSMMNGAYEDVRNLSHNLLPRELEEKGIVGAIEKLVKELSSLNKIKIEFIYRGNFEKIKESISFELYSICLELVNNAFKYSNATQITINLTEENNKIAFSIHDNGIGLENTKEGMGLSNIRKRVENVNGDLQIISQSNIGSEFKILV